MLETSKEKLKSAALFFKTSEVSEKTAIISTILVFVLILAAFLLIVNFVLPRTKIEVSLLGPETAKTGEVITYTVILKNTGNVILKNPELVFHFPSLSWPEKSLIETISFEEDLYPNQEKRFEFKAQLFGRENEKREAKTWLNYSTGKKTDLIMSKIAYLNTVISEVPIDLVLDIPQRIPTSAKEVSDFTFRIKYFSSAGLTIPYLKLSVDFPDDFTFKESIPEKSEEQKFEVPPLEHSGKGEVEITGTFPIGQEIGKELNFKAQLFISLHGTDILLKEDTANVVTYEPSFLFSQKINNQEKHLPYPGERLHYSIYFKNIKSEPVRDLTLTTVLDGVLFDLSTIEAPLGAFSPGSNSISWNGDKIAQLRYLTPGEEGSVEFWIKLKEDYKPKDLAETNASIRNRVLLAGFETEFRNRVNSQIKIAQEGYYRDKYGFFENPGKHPPIVNEITYYTIVWKLENYYNWIGDVIAKASIPEGVTLRSFKATHGEMTVATDLEVRSPYAEIPSNFRFEKPLYVGSSNDEVRYLQIILKSEVPRYYPQETPTSGYFGSVTFNAVKYFQEKYKREILEPQGLQEATGYIDELTRTKLNDLIVRGASAGPSEVIWKIANVNPGAGVLENPCVAAFQIAFVPELSQKGKIATLINEVRVSAKDQWTEMILSADDEAIDTNLPDDTTIIGSGEVR